MTHYAKQYQQLIAKCWADDAFKQRLLADPAGTLKAEGIEVPEGVRVQVVENTALAHTLVIPARPTDLSDEMLTMVAAGMVGGEMPGLPLPPGLIYVDHGNGRGHVEVREGYEHIYNK